MMTLNIGNKELKIKFGYKATIQSKIISKMIKKENELGSGTKDDYEALEKVEDILLLIPEILLVGLQKFHGDEFGYDLITGEGKQEKLDKVFDLMDEYVESGNVNFIELYQKLEEEMVNESFLSSVFQQEKAKESAKTKTKKTTEK